MEPVLVCAIGALMVASVGWCLLELFVRGGGK